MATTVHDWREHLVSLRYLAAKVAAVHGPSHPDVQVLANVVSDLADAPCVDANVLTAVARRMANLTNDFQPWAGACGSVQCLYAGLKVMVATISTPTAKA